jgi:Flp pilus assembly protein TadD
MSDSDALWQKARLFLQVRRPQEAVRTLTELLSDSPDYAPGHSLLGYSLTRLGRPEEGLDSARQAVGLAPDLAYVHHMLALVLRNQGSYDEALESASEAVRLDPQDPEHHALEAYCLFGLSRWSEARGAADRALSLDPSHVWSLNLRAVALAEIGELGAATATFDTALAESPDHTGLHVDYGDTLIRSGRAHDAVGHYREALRLDPTDDRARRGLLEGMILRSSIYRPILRWIEWSFRLTTFRGLVLAVILMTGIGGSRALFASEWIPNLLGAVVVIGFILAIWTSWVGTPLLDFLLWLRRDTRILLTPRDRKAAMSVGFMVCSAPLVGMLIAAAGNPGAASLAPFSFLAVAVPVAGCLAIPNDRPRFVAISLVFICVAMLAIGTIVATCHGLTGEAVHSKTGRVKNPTGQIFLTFSLLGGVLSTWVLTLLGPVNERR